MKTMLRTIALTAMIVLPWAVRAGTVGAEFADQDACGNAYVPNAGDTAREFINGMQAWGHTRLFLYGNGSYWPSDLVDSSVPGGGDSLYGDRPNMLLVASHGASSAARFLITGGTNRTIDGLNVCAAYTSNPNNGNQWWKMGDGNLRILSMLTCHGLELTDLAHWDPVARGIHLIASGSGNMYQHPARGANYAFWGNFSVLGLPPMFPVKSAWFIAHKWGSETAVVMAYGVNQADAVNRRDNETFRSNMSRLGPHTYRAWAWVQ